jgi:hypothetical protein
MQLATKEVPVEEAKSILERYRNVPHAPWLKAVVEGHRVIDLERTMQQAGMNEQGLPALAFVTINATYCRYDWDSPFHRFSAGLGTIIRFREPHCKIARRHKLFHSSYYWHAAAPPIPSEHYNKAKTNDILAWEVDRWEVGERKERIVVEDPVILRLLTWPMFIVIAEWDLTPLEKELFGSLR